MQALCSWLRGTKGVYAQQDWVEACVEWIHEEEVMEEYSQSSYFLHQVKGQGLPLPSVQRMVYDQWLHADLREVASQTCMPARVVEQQACQISGTFMVQMDSVVDVGSAAYAQLQKIKGQSLDHAESTDGKRNFEPKPTRLLLMSLTDGVIDFQAMEYQPTPQLSAELTPGTKVLGGGVEHLMESNQQKKVLSRILNDETLAEDSSAGDNDRPPISNMTTDPTDNHHLQEERDDRVTEGEEMAGDLDLENFEDFGGGDEFPEDAQEQWPDELDYGLVADYQEEDELIMTGATTSHDVCIEPRRLGKQKWSQPLEEPDRVLRTSSDSNLPGPSGVNLSKKQKVSLSESNCQFLGTGNSTTGLSKKPLVASVRPIAGELSDSTGEYTAVPSNANAVSLANLNAVNEAWKVQPLVKVKAHFIRVTGKLRPSNNQWDVAVLIGDDCGGQLNVHLSNQVLEKLIGFTAQEFIEHIQPRQSDPTVKARGSTGFKRCQSALADLHCYMEIRRPTARGHPLVERLLDS